MSRTNTILHDQPHHSFVAWKTIEIGNCQEVKSLISGVKDCADVSADVIATLLGVELSPSKKKIVLARLLVREIGERAGMNFSEEVSRKEVYEAVEKIGGKPCPDETAAELCLQSEVSNLAVVCMVMTKPISGHTFMVVIGSDCKWLEVVEEGSFYQRDRDCIAFVIAEE